MKADLDKLMEERGLDAMVISGPLSGNNPLLYMVGTAGVSHATVVKKRGSDPLLLHGLMEREEATKSGLRMADYNDVGWLDILQETRDPFEQRVLLMQAILQHEDVSGTVGFYGLGDVGQNYMFLKALDERLEHISVTGDKGPSLFEQAFATKDDDEFERLKSVAERTVATFDDSIKFLQSHAVQEGQLIKKDGKPLTVGDVKAFVNVRLAERGLECPDMIFAPGRDGGIPHSRGEDDTLIKIGVPIVYDLFPREAGGGYHHDMTRTFCLGFAPKEVEEAYNDVLQCFKAVVGSIKAGESAGVYQKMTCEFFESRGHPTINNTPGTSDGYIHSLGHGLGLEIHGLPRISDRADDVLEHGHVFTIEPGLYYPERGFGIRIEDVMYFGPDSKTHSLTRYSKELVVPVG